MNDKIFNESVDYIVQRAMKASEAKMTKQPDMLEASGFNESLTFIEENLNDLYVRIRMLQQINDYARQFLQSEVIKKKEHLWELLKETEAKRDSLKRKGYVLRDVSLRETSSYSKKDRDGTVIKGAVTTNRLIAVPGSEISNVEIGKMSHKQEQVAFKTNKDELVHGKEVRSIYMLDGPAKNGVSETYTLFFKNSPQAITNVDIETANCTVGNIQLFDEQGPITLPLNAKAGFKKRDANAVTFTLVDKSYRQVTYEYDAERVSPDFWQKVGEKEFAAERGLAYTFDLEAASGLKKAREDYERYARELSEWNAKKKAVEDKNAALRNNYESAYRNWAAMYGI